MTFCMTVASRPPHSVGQLMAAHRPSLSVRCQAWRRSIAPHDPVPRRRRRRRLVIARPTRRGTSAGSRRATPAARRGTPRPRARRRSPRRANANMTRVRYRPGRGLHLQRRAGRAARRRARLPRRARRPSAYVRAMLDDDRGLHRRAVGRSWSTSAGSALLVPEAHGGARRSGSSTRGRAGGDGPAAVPGPVLLVGGARDARGRAGSALDDLLRRLASGATAGTVALEELGHGDPRRPRAHPGRPQGGPLAARRARSRSCSTATPPTGCSSSARTQRRASARSSSRRPRASRCRRSTSPARSARLDARRPRRPSRSGPTGDHTALLAPRRRRQRGRRCAPSWSASMRAGATTWRSSTPRTGCSSTGPSPPSR